MKRFGYPGGGEKGFSLLEVLLTVSILTITLIGLLQLFVYCSFLSELSGNVTLAVTEAQNKLEEIRNHNYSLITADYIEGGSPGNTFNLSQGAGKGVIYIDSSNPSLLQIQVVVSWKNNKNDRVIGEDTNLNGSLDSGEDLNGNGKLDSPATVVSLIARR